MIHAAQPKQTIMVLHGFLFQSMYACIYVSASTFMHLFCCCNAVLLLELKCSVRWALASATLLLKLNCYSLDQQTDGESVMPRFDLGLILRGRVC